MKIQVLAFLAVAPALIAQFPGGPPPGPPKPAKAIAPIELTGYWVSIVSEDWRFRMIAAPAEDGSPLLLESLQMIPSANDAVRIPLEHDEVPIGLLESRGRLGEAQLEVLGVIADLLGEVPTSPALRSSLFLATAELPGIESLGTLRDPSGRVGIGVAIVESGVRTEAIFDATTSALLSTSVVRVDEEGSPTQVLSELTYEQRAIVPSIDARPR